MSFSLLLHQLFALSLLQAFAWGKIRLRFGGGRAPALCPRTRSEAGGGVITALLGHRPFNGAAGPLNRAINALEIIGQTLNKTAFFHFLTFGSSPLAASNASRECVRMTFAPCRTLAEVILASLIRQPRRQPFIPYHV